MADLLLFYQMVDQFICLYRDGAYQKALDLLDREAPQYPVGEAMTLAWQSAMLARLGRVDEAIQRLRLAYERGYWYHESALVQDPDFQLLQGNLQFEQVVGLFSMRRMVAAAQTRPALETIVPGGSGLYPLFLALHGNQSSVALSTDFWRSAADRGWLLALPQSSQPTWVSGFAVWNDMAMALTEMHAHLAQLTASYPVDPQRVVAAGFSMGAQVALRMALSPQFHLRGVVVVEAWLPEESMAELAQVVKRAPRPAPRIYLIAGKENSEYYHMAEEVYSLLQAHDIPCALEGSSNPHHNFPADFDQVLQRALTFICQE